MSDKLKFGTEDSVKEMREQLMAQRERKGEPMRGPKTWAFTVSPKVFQEMLERGEIDAQGRLL